MPPERVCMPPEGDGYSDGYKNGRTCDNPVSGRQSSPSPDRGEQHGNRLAPRGSREVLPEPQSHVSRER